MPRETLIQFLKNENDTSKASSTLVLENGEPAFDKVDGALYIGDGESSIAELNSAKKYFAQRTNGSVTTEMLATNAVTTGKLANGAVTALKLDSNAVTTEKINDSAVTTGKISDANVTVAKLYGATTAQTNPTMDDYINEKLDERIEQGIQVSATDLVITEQVSGNTKYIINAQRTEGATPASTGTATIGGFTVNYNKLTGDNTTQIIGTKISSATSSPKFELNANTSGNAFLVAKNSSGTTKTTIDNGGILNAIDPVIKIGSTSGNIVTTAADGQLASSSSIDGSKVKIGSTANQIVITGTGGSFTTTTALPNTISLKVGSTTGKIVTTTTNGVLIASDYISGSQVRVGSETNKYLITTTNGALTATNTISVNAISLPSSSGFNKIVAAIKNANDVIVSTWVSLPNFCGNTPLMQQWTSSISTFYAPTESGTSGQILQSTGANGIPEWKNLSGLTAGYASNANKLRINVNGTNGYYSATLTGSTLSFS